MRSLDRISRAQAGAPVSVLSAPAMSMLAQLQRHTRNDVLFTLSAAMDLAVQFRLVRPETRVDGFSNQLVLAGLAGNGTAVKDKAGLLSRLAGPRVSRSPITPLPPVSTAAPYLTPTASPRPPATV